MGIGAASSCSVVGLILVTGAVDLPEAVNDVIATDTVGWICVVVGVLCLVLSLVLAQQRSQGRRRRGARYDACLHLLRSGSGLADD